MCSKFDVMQEDNLCATCTEAFSRHHEADKEYEHHRTAESFHLAKESGCHMCSSIWETARGCPADMKWDFRKAKELRFRYSISLSDEGPMMHFTLDAEDDMWGSLNITLRHANSIPEPVFPISPERFPDRLSRGLHYCVHWLRNCLRNHHACRELERLNDASCLPTRLLDLRQQDDGYITLCVTSSTDKGPYLTLSHRWRTDPEPPKLLLENFSSRRGGIELSSLPASFCDAVRVARHLGVEWLWIDSLCIIQDSVEDWRAESSRMGDVYRNSLCNLAATGAAEQGGGLFPEDSIVATQLFLDLSIIPQDGRESSEIAAGSSWPSRRYRCEPVSQWPRKIEDAALNRRGWVVQERVLAPRTLHFTKTEILWECLSQCAAESVPDSLFGDVRLPFTEFALTRDALALVRKRTAGSSSPPEATELQRVQDGWWMLAHQYMFCVLTQPDDRLIAISGIAKEFRQATGDEYLAGHWKSSIISDLLWNNMPDSEPRVRTRPLVAPTWSWASIRPYAYISFAEYASSKSKEWQPLAEFVHCDVQACTDDETGQLRSATLCLRGRTFTPTSGSQLPWIHRLPTYGDGFDIDNLHFSITFVRYDEDELDVPQQIAHPVVCLPLLLMSWRSVGHPEISIAMLWLTRPSSSSNYLRIGMGTAGVDKLPRDAYDEFLQKYSDAAGCNVYID